MKGKRTSVAGLLLSAVLLLVAQGASAQEDSTRVRRDSLRTVGVGVGSPHVPVTSGLSGVGAEEYRPEPSLEAGREVPVFRPVRRDPDLRLPYLRSLIHTDLKRRDTILEGQIQHILPVFPIHILHDDDIAGHSFRTRTSRESPVSLVQRIQVKPPDSGVAHMIHLCPVP